MARPRSVVALLLLFVCASGGCDGCGPAPEAGPTCGREIHVAVHQRGASPHALEQVVEPLESGLQRVAGVSTIESSIAPSDAVIAVALAPDADPTTVLAAVERSVGTHTLSDDVTVEVRSQLRVTASVAFVDAASADDLGQPAIAMTAVGPMLDAIGLDLEALAARIRDELGGAPPSVERLQQMRVEGLMLDSIVSIELAAGPRIEDRDGRARFLRLGEGTAVTVNHCDAAPPVENLVRARIETQQDDVSFEDRRQLAAALMAMARDAGQTPYLLLDLDLAAAISGRSSIRPGATEVVVLGDAPELAEAWRSRELPGAALTVDASDVRRVRVSVEEAQSGAVLARLATSPDVAELLPSPRARGRVTARVDPERAEEAGQTVEALEAIAARSLDGIEVVPGLTLRGPPLEAARVGQTNDAPGTPVSELITLTRTFDPPLSRADGRRVRHFEARVLPETDREALLNQVLGR